MDTFAQLFDAISKNATGALLVLTLIAVGYQYRAREKRDAEHREELKAERDAHLATVKRIEPLAQKFSEVAAAVLGRLPPQIREG